MKSRGIVRTVVSVVAVAAVLQSSAFAGTWMNLGGGLAGASGVPTLIGTGLLAPATPTKLEVAFAPPLAPTVLFIAPVGAAVAFKGGVLVPFPPTVMLNLPADGVGDVTLILLWPAGIPAGLSLWFQFVIMDPAAIKGTSLSNAIMLTT